MPDETPDDRHVAETPDEPRAMGWYADPEVSGQDAWWSGFAWTEFTHKSSKRPEFSRSFWPGANSAAARGRMFAQIGVGILAFAIVVSIVAGLVGGRGGSGGILAIDGLALIAMPIFGGLAIVFGIIARTRASRLGAGFLSGLTIFIGALMLIVGIVGALIIIAGLAQLSHLS